MVLTLCISGLDRCTAACLGFHCKALRERIGQPQYRKPLPAVIIHLLVSIIRSRFLSRVLLMLSLLDVQSTFLFPFQSLIFSAACKILVCSDRLVCALFLLRSTGYSKAPKSCQECESPAGKLRVLECKGEKQAGNLQVSVNYHQMI